MSILTPVVMRFVRRAGGIGHDPAEQVAVGDVAAALGIPRRSPRLPIERE